MSYQYDNKGGFEPKKNDSDLGSWLFIGFMFIVAWPNGG